MAATGNTNEFNLPQFIDSDKPTWLGDFNEAMEKIDAALAERVAAHNFIQAQLNVQVDRIDVLVTKVEALITRMNTASTRIVALDNGIPF